MSDTRRSTGRKLMRRTKVLTIYSVDQKTETVMQGIIDRHFAAHTVLSIMHRLEHVPRYDKVLMMDAGEVVEFESPEALLAWPSKFAALYASPEQ